METTVNSILTVFENYRMAPTAVDQYESVGKSLLADKINSYVSHNNPLPFVMLGLPFKSINTRDKVLGRKPDMGEQLSMLNFKEMNEDISRVYGPGIRMHVASDGYVFNHILGVPDKEVQEYKEINLSMRDGAPVSILDLHDFYPGLSLQEKRDKLMEQFGITEIQLEQKVLMNQDTNWLYKGMIRFMGEELAMGSYNSGNQLHKAAKKLARQMMLFNEAYSNLVSHEMGSMIRVSMHSTVNNGKYSINLIKGKDIRHSPWHSAVVVENDTVTTMHKKDALAAGYELVYENNQPYYFTR